MTRNPSPNSSRLCSLYTNYLSDSIFVEVMLNVTLATVIDAPSQRGFARLLILVLFSTCMYVTRSREKTLPQESCLIGRDVFIGIFAK